MKERNSKADPICHSLRRHFAALPPAFAPIGDPEKTSSQKVESAKEPSRRSEG
jgi:hypothetical protein